MSTVLQQHLKRPVAALSPVRPRKATMRVKKLVLSIVAAVTVAMLVVVTTIATNMAMQAHSDRVSGEHIRQTADKRVQALQADLARANDEREELSRESSKVEPQGDEIVRIGDVVF